MSVALERKMLEKTYEGVINAYVCIKKKVDGETKLVREKLYENVKCALSKVSTPSTNQTQSQNAISYKSKLFVSPEINIPPGSEIEVSQHGRTYTFINSAESFSYPTHQELMLERKDNA